MFLVIDICISSKEIRAVVESGLGWNTAFFPNPAEIWLWQKFYRSWIVLPDLEKCAKVIPIQHFVQKSMALVITVCFVYRPAHK